MFCHPLFKRRCRKVKRMEKNCCEKMGIERLSPPNLVVISYLVVQSFPSADRRTKRHREQTKWKKQWGQRTPSKERRIAESRIERTETYFVNRAQKTGKTQSKHSQHRKKEHAKEGKEKSKRPGQRNPANQLSAANVQEVTMSKWSLMESKPTLSNMSNQMTFFAAVRPLPI